MSRQSETRMLYAFEAHPCEPACPFWFLQWLLQEVWKAEAPRPWRRRPPQLEFRGGYTNPSYCYGRRRIVLAMPQTATTLIHEVTHALRNGDPLHNKKFVRRYFDLLIKYHPYRYDPILLHSFAKLYGVKV